ncbi:hypothetical protein EJV47_25565 [Hymenobacter gummosus]|uniref:Uncharacterized protein n=1 Tax=Hymenobacter gummosus TaxID=1776032 RepID=A0A3S0H589_9BACT|nr:hypothetical protein [Hymenobacter gummosus]RTQ45249.1 hypothetical protein EJV47_25565 [Hymenobacter gummosus]
MATAGNNLTFSGAGNVGIGSASPTQKLVVGGSVFASGEGTGFLTDSQPNARVGLIKYGSREGGIWRTSGQDFEIGRVDAGVTALPGTPSAWTTDLYVGGDGSVGIGNTGPTNRLDVSGTFRSLMTNGSFRTNDFGAIGGIATVLLGTWDGFNGNGPQVRMQGAGTGFIDIGQNGSGDFVVEGNDAARLTVQNGGNVGIGTSTPSSTLQVNGSLAVKVTTGLAGNSAGTLLGDAGYVGLSPAAGADYYLLPRAQDVPGRLYYLRNNSGNAPAYISVSASGGGIFDGASNAPANNNVYQLNATGSTKTITVISDGTNWTFIRTAP